MPSSTIVLSSDDEFQSFEEAPEEIIGIKRPDSLNGEEVPAEDEEHPTEYFEVPADKNHSKEDNKDSHMEEEFHTEESDISDHEDDNEDNGRGKLQRAIDEVDLAMNDNGGEDEESEDDIDEPPTPSAPLLPLELLQATPAVAPAAQHMVFDEPSKEHLSRKEKRSARNRSRRAKQRMWDRLRRDSEGTGTLQAGQVAQMRRGVESRVQDGRVQKTKARKPKVSGREEMVLKRRLEVQNRRKHIAQPGQRKPKNKAGR